MSRPPEHDLGKSKLTMVLKAMGNLRRMQILSELKSFLSQKLRVSCLNYRNQPYHSI